MSKFRFFEEDFGGGLLSSFCVAYVLLSWDVVSRFSILILFPIFYFTVKKSKSSFFIGVVVGLILGLIYAMMFKAIL